MIDCGQLKERTAGSCGGGVGIRYEQSRKQERGHTKKEVRYPLGARDKDDRNYHRKQKTITITYPVSQPVCDEESDVISKLQLPTHHPRYPLRACSSRQS